MVRLIDFVARWAVRAVVVLVLLAVVLNVLPLSRLTEPVGTVVQAVADLLDGDR